MKDIKVLIGLALVLSLGSVSYAAADKSCEAALAAAEPSQDLDKHFQELASDWKSGWTDRGFLGFQNNSPTLNSESYMYALKNGLMWWNLRIYLVKDLEEAKAHNALVEDSMMKGVYVVGADESAVDLKSDEDAHLASRAVKGESLKGLIEKAEGLTEFLEDGSVRKISIGEVNSRLNFSVVSKIKPDKYAHGKNCFTHAGWAATKKRGMIQYDEFSNSPYVRNGRKLARKLIALGYEIKVNADYQKSLDMARDQLRVVKVDGVKKREKNSRYLKKELYDAALAMKDKDLAFSVELYRPDGKLVGGSINFVVGNLITGDTIFYDLNETTYADELGQTVQIEPIEYARLVDVVTFEYMVALGIPFMDIGMVSDYSKTLNGRIFPREEYLGAIQNLSKDEIRLPAILDPYQYPDSNFADLAKGAKVKALTKSMFLGGYALATEATQAKALAHSLIPGELHIFVVSDSKEAEEHAKSHGYKDNVIYFMSGQNPIQIPTADGAAANELVNLVIKNGAIAVDAKTGKGKLIQAQRFKGILNSKLGTQYMSWKIDSESSPHVVVRGWRLQ